MYSNNGGSYPQEANIGGACKRDFEREILGIRKNLKVKSNMKMAMEQLKDVCGTPHGREVVPFYAMYGDMCFEVTQLNNKLDLVIAEQEAYERKQAEKAAPPPSAVPVSPYNG
jgi:hypothetical protein